MEYLQMHLHTATINFNYLSGLFRITWMGYRIG